MAPRPLIVADMVTDTSEWDWERLLRLPPHHLIEQIAAELPPNCDANFPEDIIHVLRDCIVARDLWAKVLPLAQLNSFFQLHSVGWLQVNLFALDGFFTVSIEWPRKFVILCWLLWENRCCRVMRSNCLHREELLVRGSRLLEECISSFQVRRDVVARDLLER
ncbi:hypothetical protein V6N11_037803 [Hibiscus sabdariffa]|uniref:Uncharacterized protein n=1 Tax=Hibiscus sabdariffa TaxID=183260 RepID=A0ABR2NAV1_9ROSI